MVAFRAGARPVLSSCALAALTALAGCSSAGTTSYTAQNPAIVPKTVAQAATVLEDDGIPAQAPPPARIRAMPDSPDEPFSRNYGGSNPAALGAGTKPTRAAPPVPDNRQPARTPPVASNQPSIAQPTLVTALSQDE